MNALAQWKAELKQAGYKLSVKTLSHGQHVTYKMLDGRAKTGNVFTAESLQTWKPLFDLINKSSDLINKVREETGYFGLKG